MVHTSYHFKVHHAQVAGALDRLADMLARPLLITERLLKEVENVHAGRHRRGSQGDSVWVGGAHELRWYVDLGGPVCTYTPPRRYHTSPRHYQAVCFTHIKLSNSAFEPQTNTFLNPSPSSCPPPPEFSRNCNSDQRKGLQLRRSGFLPPYSQFSTGNLSTLRDGLAAAGQDGAQMLRDLWREAYHAGGGNRFWILAGGGRGGAAGSCFGGGGSGS